MDGNTSMIYIHISATTPEKIRDQRRSRYSGTEVILERGYLTMQHFGELSLRFHRSAME